MSGDNRIVGIRNYIVPNTGHTKELCLMQMRAFGLINLVGLLRIYPKSPIQGQSSTIVTRNGVIIHIDHEYRVIGYKVLIKSLELVSSDIIIALDKEFDQRNIYVCPCCIAEVINRTIDNMSK